MSNVDKLPPKAAARGPVRWLLGGRLLWAVKSIFLYALNKDKSDTRDWMQAQCYDEFEPKDGEFWFDYLADSGDGSASTYSIAYLCMGGIDLNELDCRDLSNEQKTYIEGRPRLLPRGEFLFVGGDTAYHVADYPTLVYRFRTPFRWAFKDLLTEGKVDPRAERRPIFGLPGNHDYYDLIDGFHRQFCKPLTEDGDPLFSELEKLTPQLSLPGYRRVQTATYTALKLPFNWWFWGIDSEAGNLDPRQQKFFRSLNGGQTPDRLIVATPEPAVVFAHKPNLDERTPKAMQRLHLQTPFFGEDLKPGQYRVDLSGDVHHYERYWGYPRGNKAESHAGDHPRYASIVAGGGGAFHHPSTTNLGEIPRQIVYPSAEDSRRAVADQLFSLKNVITGGWLWAVGAILAFIIRFLMPAELKSLNSWEAVSSTFFAMRPSLALLKAVGGVVALVIMSLFAYKRIVKGPRPEFWMALAGAFGGIAFDGYFRINAGEIGALTSSLLIVLAFVASGVLSAVVIWYTEHLFKLAADVPEITRWNYSPNFCLGVLAGSFPLLAIMRLGSHPASLLTSNVIFVVTTMTTFLGLTALAGFVGGHFQRSLLARFGFFVLGIWHWLLQLAVPLVWAS